MSDFYQTGVVATLHNLERSGAGQIESSLSRCAQEKPIALVLPSLSSEIGGSALEHIVTTLKDVEFVKKIVVTLGLAKQQDFEAAKSLFAALPQETTILWNDGPRLRHVYRAISGAGLQTGLEGKGRSVWMACGYVLSQRELQTIVLHDCDITTYDRRMLTRLSYPVADRSLEYDFCKGFYSRVTDRLHGRVTRLLVTPLIRALEKTVGYHPLLVFLDSFRYPLAGEFSMDVNLARVIQIPGDWGLEVGVLAEVYRNTSMRRICQVDIAENYEHKHQSLSPLDPTKGLHKMAVDICKSIFRTLASEGIVFTDGLFKTLVATYVRTAQDLLKSYGDDAVINALVFDRHEEGLAVETFTNGIKQAAEAIVDDPLGAPLISAWDRVTSAIPHILDTIRTAVDEDNA